MDVRTISLTNEYTTAMLTNIALTELGSGSWSSGANPCAAYRNLSEDERSISLQKLRYHFTFASETGKVYRVTWVEQSVVEGSTSTTTVAKVDIVTATGTSSTTTNQLLDPPTATGTNYVIGVVAHFQVKAGHINDGFDPTGTEPWTSVGVGSTNQIVQLVVNATDFDRIKNDIQLVKVSGGSAIDLSPTTISNQTTDLTIRGLAANSDVTVEVQLISTGLTLAKLHVMALEWQTVPAGIYRVVDNQSQNTAPVNAPTDQQTLTDVNDCLKQACVHFTRANANQQDETLNVRYDTGVIEQGQVVGADDGLFQIDERGAILAQQLTGKIQLFYLRNSGMKYVQNPAFMARGGTPQNERQSYVCTKDCADTQSWTAGLAAHEFGHILDLSTRFDPGDAPQAQEQHHDPGPFPNGTGGLMKSGRPVNNVRPPVPAGKWLRHEDWKKANEKAFDIITN